MNLFDIFNSENFDKMLEKALEKEMSKPQSKNQIYEELADNYIFLLNMLNIKNFNLFGFPDYEDCRRITIDSNEYDFNNEFNHNHKKVKEALYTIECLIADLEEDSLEKILKKIEKTINKNFKD